MLVHSSTMFMFAILKLQLAFLIFNHPVILVIESRTLSLDSDKDALINFRSQMSLDPSNPLSTWDKNSSPCNWTRVVCNKFKQRVIALDLSSLQLVGSISSHIGNLSFLQSLQLQNNQLSNSIPNEVCNLLRLKVLNLSTNNLQGSIPSNISKLRELMVMDLTMNNISGRIPKEVSFLPRLRVLNLASNKLSGPIPPSLGNLTSMKILDLGTNALSGTIPSELHHLRSLEHLDLSINNLTGTVPTPIYNMSSLVFLALASNQLWGELPYNVGETLPNLITFYFCINKFTGRIPGSLQNLTNIQVIRMAHNRLTGTIPPGLGNLPFLKMYNIGYNNIVNHLGEENGLDFITSLANSTQLNFLAFDGNLLEGFIPDSIGNLSKVLSKLYMGQNQIHGSIPSSIGKLIGLSLLNISNNEITGSLPNELSHLQDLQVLDMAMNHISGVIPGSMGVLTKLTKLDVSGNKLSGSIPSSFRGFNLGYIDLSSNLLNGTIPKEILTLSGLSTLNLSNNHFDGQLPDELELLTTIITIDLSNNRLSGRIPNSISNCKNLETLNMARNLFSGSIPSSLENLLALQVLNLSHNQLSGSIPSNFTLLNATQSLDLSFNNLEGELPCGGIFTNLSKVHLQGNPKISLHLACENAQVVDHDHTRKFSNIDIVIVSVVVFVTFLVVGSFIFVIRKKKAKLSRTADSKFEGFYMVKYDELRLATQGFSEEHLIGRGGFGQVFKGYLKDNMVVAIKVLDMKLSTTWKSFLAECEALRNVRHRNLVKLITSCSSLDNKNMEFLALVYEFLGNGSLEDWMKGKRKKEDGDGLNLMERLSVVIDVACALDYLHHDSEVPVVHCDLKPSNILLDEDFTAKIGDFGLAKLLMERMGDPYSISSSHVLKGAIGYMPPEYGLGVKPSTAGDTYSFGVTLLELFTGKSPSHESFTGEQGLIAWVQSCVPTQMMEQLLDPELRTQLRKQANDGDYDLEQIKTPDEHLECCLVTIFEVGLSCTAAHPDRRITMTKALNKLKAVRNKLIKY
ncbi:probable LRR receptor-like serine/threonine-protein kinase At3g47570 [Amaranthus tricolor]|uniref:probable LRR receptor-like serine/threonine-protein kinase At3g47570 n=1 Tax=Amaranthus tricolor TaxID=29722 RepID=UPI002589BCE9|nr:probable LRR receptor-like serine/threonine-protein kinase At3g47570 [Amaranthus tricolor]